MYMHPCTESVLSDPYQVWCGGVRRSPVSQQVILGMLLGVDNMLLNMAMKETEVNTIVLTTMEWDHVTDPINTAHVLKIFLKSAWKLAPYISGLRHYIFNCTHPWLNANVLLRCCPVSYLDVWTRPLKRRSIVMSCNRIICRMIELCNVCMLSLLHW
jgi:hypothetical protein